MLTDKQRQRVSCLVHEALLRIRVLAQFRDLYLPSYQSNYHANVDWRPIVDDIIANP